MRAALARMGEGRARRVFMSARLFGTAEAVDLGLAQYIVEEGLSFEKAMEIADKVARNLPLTNFAICSAVSHMNNMSGLDAAFAEAFVGGIVNTQPDARARLEAFANKTAARVRPKNPTE